MCVCGTDGIFAGIVNSILTASSDLTGARQAATTTSLTHRTNHNRSNCKKARSSSRRTCSERGSTMFNSVCVYLYVYGLIEHVPNDYNS